MSNVKIGDTFTIEIDRVYKDDTGRTLYGVKGFNALVFDDVGIDKLKHLKKENIYIEEEVEQIRKEEFEHGQIKAWNLAARIQSIILSADKVLTRDDYFKIFDGLCFSDVLKRFTPEKAKNKIDEFLKQKEEKKAKETFCVGDILLIRGHDKKCIVTDIEEGQYCHLVREDGRCFWAKIDNMEGEYEKVDNNDNLVKLLLKNINRKTIQI